MKKFYLRLSCTLITSIAWTYFRNYYIHPKLRAINLCNVAPSLISPKPKRTDVLCSNTHSLLSHFSSLYHGFGHWCKPPKKSNRTPNLGYVCALLELDQCLAEGWCVACTPHLEKPSLELAIILTYPLSTSLHKIWYLVFGTINTNTYTKY